MIKNIEYSKFKRFFSFGCSFTNYIWATWADILSKEMPDAEFYNFGQGGAGNLFISSRIAEANTRFNFCETDLVVVMYTTFTREDRWVDGRWLTLGNIYNQNLYPKAWVENFADEIGYLIRDLSLIELSYEYIKNKSCTSIVLSARPFSDAFEGPDREKIQPKDVLDVYKQLQNKVYTLSDLEKDIHSGNSGHRYKNDQGKFFHDGHPRPMQHYNYLIEAGFQLSDNAKQFALVQEENLLKSNSFDDIKENCMRFLKQQPKRLF